MKPPYTSCHAIIRLRIQSGLLVLSSFFLIPDKKKNDIFFCRSTQKGDSIFFCLTYDRLAWTSSTYDDKYGTRISINMQVHFLFQN